MALTGSIIDKSVAARVCRSPGLEQLVHAEGTPLYLCEVGLLEQLYSAKNARDYDRLETILRTSFDMLRSPPDVLVAAQHLQQDLADHRGLWHHRPIPNLLIAITALPHDVGVVHADNDFDLIAQVRPLRSWNVDIT